MFLLSCQEEGTTSQNKAGALSPVDSPVPPPPDPSPVAADTQPTPARLAPQARIDSFRDQAFVTYRFEPTQCDLRLYNPDGQGGTHTFASLAEVAAAEGKKLVLAMNGGMFQADRSAQGLLVAKGEVLSPLDRDTAGYGNFYLQPNGVWAIDRAGRAYVVPTQRYDSLARQHDIHYATQSGPMMLIDSVINPLFNDGSPNRHIRNAVGVTAAGEVVLAISQREVTFFELSSLLRGMGCTQALYLDGFVSRLYLPALSVGSLADGAQLGPLIAIFD